MKNPNMPINEICRKLDLDTIYQVNTNALLINSDIKEPLEYSNITKIYINNKLLSSTEDFLKTMDNINYISTDSFSNALNYKFMWHENAGLLKIYTKSFNFKKAL